jgi:putative endonuclease
MSREERQQRAMHDRVQLVLHEDLAPPHDTTITRGARSEEPRRHAAPQPRATGPYMSREERQQRATHDRVQQVLHRDLAPPADTTITRGARSEELAAAHLVHCGYRIVERNFRTKLGELDIIARDGSILVFVEVRSRTTAEYGQAIEMVNIHKQRKVTRMAWQYIKTRRPVFEMARFDVVGITAGELVHIKDAFRLG